LKRPNFEDASRALWALVTEVYHLSLGGKHVASKERVRQGLQEIHLPNVMHLSGFSLLQLRQAHLGPRRCPATSLVGWAETLYPRPSRILRVQVAVAGYCPRIKAISQVGRNRSARVRRSNAVILEAVCPHPLIPKTAFSTPRVYSAGQKMKSALSQHKEPSLLCPASAYSSVA
jgi:hypothetical protein